MNIAACRAKSRAADALPVFATFMQQRVYRMECNPIRLPSVSFTSAM